MHYNSCTLYKPSNASVDSSKLLVEHQCRLWGLDVQFGLPIPKGEILIDECPDFPFLTLDQLHCVFHLYVACMHCQLRVPWGGGGGGGGGSHGISASVVEQGCY